MGASMTVTITYLRKKNTHDTMLTDLNDNHGAMKTILRTLTTTTDKDVMLMNLQDLLCWWDKHMSGEQALMERVQYPFLRGHTVEHTFLRNEIKELLTHLSDSNIIWWDMTAAEVLVGIKEHLKY